MARVLVVEPLAIGDYTTRCKRRPKIYARAFWNNAVAGELIQQLASLNENTNK
jgi:hypothetical protein